MSNFSRDSKFMFRIKKPNMEMDQSGNQGPEEELVKEKEPEKEPMAQP